jgi:hypothetical protein
MTQLPAGIRSSGTCVRSIRKVPSPRAMGGFRSGYGGLGSKTKFTVRKGEAMPDEEYIPAQRFRRGEPETDLNDEMWRLVRLTREAARGRADAERRLRARLAGWRDAGSWLSEYEEARNVNESASPYPRSWHEAADEARRDPSPKRPRFDVRGRPRDD